MKRRKFITLFGGAVAWPLAARTQQHKMLRVGFVGMQPREAPHYTNFLRRMAELGYQEGRNFTFDYIQAPNVEGYESNYRELATRKVDVFLAVGSEPALRAALSAADGKPIAFLAVDFDPLAKGYVANLSHPGGNVTGIFVRQIELAAKRVEIAREAFPRATVVGIAFDAVSSEQRDAAVEAARKLGLEPRMIEVKGEQGYGGAFDAMEGARGQPIILPGPDIPARPRGHRASIAGAPHSVDRGIPGEHGGWRADQLRLRPHGAVLRHRELCPAACRGCQAVRHTDRAIAALLHGGQSQDGGIARCFFVGCVHRSGQRGARMKRREFISLLGAAAAWPLAARAQQPMPVVGFLNTLGQNDRPNLPAAFRRGLAETGYVDGRNVAIEYRFAENQHDRLPALAADLVGRKVNVIVATGGGASVLAAIAATKTIPIVFTSGGDPVQEGYVASLNRPGGNVTGVSMFSVLLAGKALGLLHELVPNVALVALLANPKLPESARMPRDAQEAARTLGRQLLVPDASTPSEIDAAFATMRERRAGALLVGGDPFFSSRRQQIVALAARDGIAAIYTNREFVEEGG
jgi:putative tryptophan/tyrosine transport system substrate-binding protein